MVVGGISQSLLTTHIVLLVIGGVEYWYLSVDTTHIVLLARWLNRQGVDKQRQVASVIFLGTQIGAWATVDTQRVDNVCIELQGRNSYKVHNYFRA